MIFASALLYDKEGISKLVLLIRFVMVERSEWVCIVVKILVVWFQVRDDVGVFPRLLCVIVL